MQQMCILCSSVTNKLASACSRCMSGIRGRLLSVRETDNDIHIKGFNNTTSIVTNIGYNEDNKMEYYISSIMCE